MKMAKGWRGESGRHSLAAKGIRSRLQRKQPLGRVCRGKSRRIITNAQARAVGGVLGVKWDTIELEQFRKGMQVELEHGCRDLTTNVTFDDLVPTGKIALAHLKESSDYYRELEKMEKRL